ncbi:ATP-binding protein [Streptomyces silvensis]|uniref:Histidine kinase/HSP90-like ATPase domain-containing protein n=1 Tax=Streptomyces silvensis TaxID=1765722 RepID=A0A0W7XAR6_9ACTN|nr:ATP-binding protein [Streptomyces silvensis]KUF20089.1 hypothetical protein AT728_28375 [Streptomyces silvensis]
MTRIDGPSSNGTAPELLGGMVLHPIPESVGRARRWYRKFTEPWLVRVRWYRVGDALRVDVHNSGWPAHVRMRSPDVTEAHGRGLLLVDELADEWWSGPSAYGGTVVVFVMRQAFKPRQPGL